MKKRYGYSLAEAMVALSIVGVIALLVMPIIKSKMQDISNLSKLQKVYNSLTDAVGNWMVDDRISEIRATSYISAHPERFMPKYLRTMQESNTSTEGLLGKVYTDRNSHQFRVDFQDKYDCALLQNGSTLCLTPYNDDKYITRFGVSDGEAQVVRKSKKVEYNEVVKSLKKIAPSCPLKQTANNPLIRSAITNVENANKLIDDFYNQLLNGDYNTFYNNQDFKNMFIGLTSDDFFIRMFNEVKRGDDSASRLLEIPNFLEMYNFYENDEWFEYAKRYICAGNLCGRAFISSTYNNLADIEKKSSKGVGAIANDMCNIPHNGGWAGEKAYTGFVNDSYLYALFTDKNFIDYLKATNKKIFDNRANLDPNFLNSTTNSWYRYKEWIKNSTEDECCNLYNQLYGTRCDEVPQFRLTEELIKKYRTEYYDETVPAEPTYTAPSESGKVNISQEQVHAHSSDKPIMEVVVDTNGASKPNKLGTDLFIFYIYPDGHVGVRSQDTSTNNCYMNQYYQCFKAVFNNDWKKPY